MTKKPMQLPLVSVVIPCRNEEGFIEACIQSVLQSAYPPELLEVFVCDGRSTDRTREIVEEIAKNETRVRLLDNVAQTTPHALNLGIRSSNGEVVIILGAHAEIDREYVPTCVEILQSQQEIGCAGGVLENVFEDGDSRVISLAMSSPFGVGSAYFRTGATEGFVETVAFGAYKREVFEKAGLFDEDLIRNQDDEFNFRIGLHGYRIFLSKKIRARYFVRASLTKLFRQYYQYGYWKVYVNRKHKTITTLRQLVPAGFVAFLLSGLAMFFLPSVFGLLWLAGLAIYLIGACTAAFKKTTKIAEVILMGQTFFILHFSYGLGYLEGIFHFLILRKKPKSSSGKLSR